jgi:hypothetical protein
LNSVTSHDIAVALIDGGKHVPDKLIENRPHQTHVLCPNIVMDHFGIHGVWCETPGKSYISALPHVFKDMNLPPFEAIGNVSCGPVETLVASMMNAYVWLVENPLIAVM